MECSIGTQMRKQSVSDVKSTEPRSDLGSLSPAKALLSNGSALACRVPPP